MVDVQVTGTMAQGQFNEMLVVLSFGKKKEDKTSVKKRMKKKRGRETRQEMDDA